MIQTVNAKNKPSHDLRLFPNNINIRQQMNNYQNQFSLLIICHLWCRRTFLMRKMNLTYVLINTNRFPRLLILAIYKNFKEKTKDFTNYGRC
ncbi:unnamed protein product [Paramecium sonneborni]|uniref:Uncharacterized protein n=1 Tax=Paramecium sonneborni TaxID=65129 RepID=A0A8S1LEH3_9CILI|nr:unnamed protein product [Paramecium sonneborni]